MHNETTLYVLLFAIPLVVGILIAVINSDATNNFTESIEAWIRRQQEKVSYKRGWLFRFGLNPMLILINKFSDFTDSFSHRGLKNGTRFTITLYFAAIWIYLLSIAFVFIAVTFIICYVFYYVVRYYILSSKK